MHHQALLIAGFAAFAIATPAPQNIDFAAINAAAPVAMTGPAPNATQEAVTINPASASVEGAAKATAVAVAAATAAQKAKRGWGWGGSTATTSCTTSVPSAVPTHVEAAPATTPPPAAPPAATPAERVPCAIQPDGYGPKVQPDTTDAFLAYAEFHSEAKGALTPSSYTQTFVDLNAAVSANSYLGLTTFKSYDVAKCGALCDNTDLCTGFNIYVERDPSVDPSDTCSNPASITNYKCTLWGSGVDSASATNSGQWRDSFQVVITGSNGYEKEPAPATQPGWKAPQQCGGGTKAHSHPSTSLGQSFFPGPYNPALCASYAAAQNKKNAGHVSSLMKMVFRTDAYSPYQCKFFNAYMLEKNGKPMGTYCSLFAQSYGSDQATYEPGQQGSDTWTCSRSYGYDIAS
ncbi:hypothetical protein DSL72_003972 [Monilinia vaccinii-corymbosi]|uniref:Uncharacterized protein n=1 Tax=Monilinia vaccinii-corymbosi TaxID=61207 RepID=A0A8A3P6R6_9HELO|nr:hypothetical protein DSL72_003972 [Monilinia vaccinii-corymbosi]